MRFNLLLYVPALADSLNIDYGVFIQHHLMDDRDIKLDYFNFSEINPENYALDIVEEKEVTKKLRKDCLEDGFTLNSYYSINLKSDYNRSINREEVRQIFVCFKNNSTEKTKAFIRLTEGQKIKDYQIKDNLIIFKLWSSPEMEGVSPLSLELGKGNYSDFELFHKAVKQKVNQQWHQFLKSKIGGSSGGAVSEPDFDSDRLISTTTQPSNDNSIDAGSKANSQGDSKPTIPVITDVKPSKEVGATDVKPSEEKSVTVENQGSEAFKVIAHVLLALGILSVIAKLFLSAN